MYLFTHGGIFSMTRKQIQAKVRELINDGAEREQVFVQFARHGVKAGELAYYISSCAGPVRRDEHHGKVLVLLALMVFQTLIAFLAGYGIAAKLGPNTGWIGGILVALFAISIGWGFYKNWIGAYNAYIFLTVIELSPSFDRFAANPIPTVLAAIFNIALLAFVWYVRGKLFPDLVFLSPKKVRGRYVFTD
jgi:hypothetical protein